MNVGVCGNPKLIVWNRNTAHVFPSTLLRVVQYGQLSWHKHQPMRQLDKLIRTVGLSILFCRQWSPSETALSQNLCGPGTTVPPHRNIPQRIMPYRLRR